jgi:hypothetical protein
MEVAPFGWLACVHNVELSVGYCVKILGRG